MQKFCLLLRLSERLADSSARHFVSYCHENQGFVVVCFMRVVCVWWFMYVPPRLWRPEVNLGRVLPLRNSPRMQAWLLREPQGYPYIYPCPQPWDYKHALRTAFSHEFQSLQGMHFSKGAIFLAPRPSFWGFRCVYYSHLKVLNAHWTTLNGHIYLVSVHHVSFNLYSPPWQDSLDCFPIY